MKKMAWCHGNHSNWEDFNIPIPFQVKRGCRAIAHAPWAASCSLSLGKRSMPPANIGISDPSIHPPRDFPISRLRARVSRLGSQPRLSGLLVETRHGVPKRKRAH